jgi:hypothetical protein
MVKLVKTKLILPQMKAIKITLACYKLPSVNQFFLQKLEDMVEKMLFL